MFTPEEIKEIEKIEKAIPDLSSYDCVDIKLDTDIDINRIKIHIEKKHKGVIVDRLKLNNRKCVKKNWIEKYI